MGELVEEDRKGEGNGRDEPRYPVSQSARPRIFLREIARGEAQGNEEEDHEPGIVDDDADAGDREEVDASFRRPIGF